MFKKNKLFLSYCSKDESIADIVDNTIQSYLGNLIYISRFTRNVAYKDSFKKFMNSIGKHDFALSIVSDNYLKSTACMYEVGEILKNADYANKLLFIVLNDDDREYYPSTYTGNIRANIYNAMGRAEYIYYWQNQYKELKQKIDLIDDYEAKKELIADLSIIKKIMDFDISPFMSYLSDANGKTFSGLKNGGFNEIISLIYPGFNNVIFKECTSFEKVFEVGIKKLSELSGTDYNQIILFQNIGTHATGLIVVADIISNHKQHYRQVAVNGLISRCFKLGKIINISDVQLCSEYFPAVVETRSELLIPIKSNGACIGVLNIESEEKNYFNKELQNKIEILSNSLGVILSELHYDGGFKDGSIPYISLFYKDIGDH